MLWMIQRVFYGHLGVVSEEVAPQDLNGREQLAVWPLVALMLLMGVASPYWMHTLDANAVKIATGPSATRPPATKRLDAQTTASAGFVDPRLSQDALSALDGKSGNSKGTQPAPAPEGRLY